MSTRSKKPLRDNLVVLMSSPNAAVMAVVPLDDPRVAEAGVLVDEKSGAWSAPPVDDPVKPRTECMIGESRYVGVVNRENLVIGVFDRTRIGHLNLMVSAATDAMRDRAHSLDD